MRNLAPGLIFSVFAGLLAGLAGFLAARAPEAFYQLVQEDGALEWATFWGFMLAAGHWARAWRVSTRQPWRSVYLLALSLGCALLAMEEISWGQRLLLYQPPETFLASNVQQELNLHNFASSSVRKAVLLSLLLGFGVLWPVIGRVGLAGRWLRVRGLTAPAPLIAPGFLIAAGLYVWYPWHATGELVELLAAMGFLSASLEYPRDDSTDIPAYAGGFLLLAGFLGVITPILTPAADDPARIQLAQSEADSLAADFRSKRLRSRCGVHKRIFTFAEEYGSRRMQESEFAVGTDPVTIRRRSYYLDPWNLPYWIRHRCDGAQNVVYVYSFGPNRRRDSTAKSLVEDDVGAYISR